MTTRTAVAAGHPATVAAAVEVLHSGGNAFDATIAAGMAASVAEPGLTSLGGGGFLLAHPIEADPILFDFFVDTPGRGRTFSEPPDMKSCVVRFKGADQVFHAGHGSVATPGCLDGFLHVHRRLGDLPLDQVVAPARRLAEEGLTINTQQAEVFALLEEIFALTTIGREMFFTPTGRLLGAGDHYENPRLASFLERLGRGDIHGFGHPLLATELGRDMAANRGSLTSADLEEYRVEERRPLVFRHGGAVVLTNPAPSFGGLLIQRALGQLSATQLGLMSSTTQARAAALHEIAEHHRSIGAKKGTTHVSVSDDRGNLAAMTTSNGTCSGVFHEESGIQLNNIMGEEDLHPGGLHTDQPGLRVGSMMAPTFLEFDEGPRIALGSGGSERIRSALTLVISNLIDKGMDLEEAIRSPRMHWDGTILQLEPGLSDEDLASLSSEYRTRVWTETNLYFGGVHAVSTTGDAVGDLRRGGSTGPGGVDGSTK